MGDAGVLFLETADDIHLVFHQGDQRGNHDSRSWHDKGGQLEAQRLPASCWHKDKRVLPLNQVADNGFLVSFKRIVSEKGFQF